MDAGVQGRDIAFISYMAYIFHMDELAVDGFQLRERGRTVVA